MGALPNVYTGYQPVGDPDAQRRFGEAWGVALGRAARPHRHRGLRRDGGRARASRSTSWARTPCSPTPTRRTSRRRSAASTSSSCRTSSSPRRRQLADVVLPAASFAEKDGTFTNTERRVQLLHRAVASPGRGARRLARSSPSWPAAWAPRPAGATPSSADIMARDRCADAVVRRHQLRPPRRGRPLLAVPGPGAPRHADPARRAVHARQGKFFPVDVPAPGRGGRRRVPADPDDGTHARALPHRHDDAPLRRPQRTGADRLRRDQSGRRRALGCRRRRGCDRGDAARDASACRRT